MGNFVVGFLLPSLLLAAALMNWSLISLVDLIAVLVILYNLPKIGCGGRRHFSLLWLIIVFSLLAIISQVVYLIVWALKGEQWNTKNAPWANSIGFMVVDSWTKPTVVYFLVVQLLVVFVSVALACRASFRQFASEDSCWAHFLTFLEHLGSRLRVVSCVLLPAVQLAVGISNPSWLSLPFFIGSCAGLVDWSLTSNFLGLFRWWRLLRLYASLNIVLLYAYQLPVELSSTVDQIANFIGLFKVCRESELPENLSGLSLAAFYVLLCFIRCDLEEMEFFVSARESSLTERLIPSRHSLFVRESRSGLRHTNVLLRGAVFRTFSINFFTYGLPVSLFALSYWSFHFASICAFMLLVYVGYIVYAFPSLFRMHRLNGLLLVFILLWTVSTFIFNVAFPFLSRKQGMDMQIWDMVGLWHYPIPGLFLLAQFCLGVLVALGNLVNNSVFLYLSEEAHRPSTDNSDMEVEGTKVFIVATIAWGLRRCSRAITLALIFLVSMKPGFIHAVYAVFFLVYLLTHDIGRKIRQFLILLCQVHFTMLYILEIDLISHSLEQEGSTSREILLQLGLLENGSSWDFFEVALLACFCAIHNHGFDMLFSFSAIVQHTPTPPVGFSILKAGLNKSVLLTVYSNATVTEDRSTISYESRISSFLTAVGRKFLTVYRSCGTYIAFVTILFTVYLVKPNYISFGYIFHLLFWIIGRQLVEKTKKRLWFPLKAYAVVVFLFIYSLSSFPSFRTWLSKYISMHYIGYNPEASLLENVWESLAVLIVMQLYSYERRQSQHDISYEKDPLDSGVRGFFKRFLIWHSQKILFVSLFYASLSPISAFGFVYLLGLLMCSMLPKTSRVPSKSFLLFTGFLVTVEYLFQLCGMQARMFPGQKYSDLSLFLGLRQYSSGFWGLESGLRAKVLVVAACCMQYNVFHWLDKMPTAILGKGKWEEPCPLFVSHDDVLTNGSEVNGEYKLPSGYVPDGQRNGPTRTSWPSFSTGHNHSADFGSNKAGGSDSGGAKRFSFGYIWGSTRESQKWDKMRILAFRKERLETQKVLLKVYVKFWVENVFNLYGLEMNMIALLLASFALLNAFSMLYISLLAACILLNRGIMRKIWPIFVSLFACILILEYFAIWRNTFPLNEDTPSETTIQCHDCWNNAAFYYHYCKKCWLGLLVDDPRMLISYFAVFMLACFKLRADRLASLSGSSTYRQMISQRQYTFVWKDLSFETKSMWTFLDYLRLYCYCHLLDLVLCLILITGTLEYDILHLGYLAFALVFFRMRLVILKKRNKIFKYLRIYNFALIILTLAYQSPFIGVFSCPKCKTINYIYDMIGFYKYDYGFRITARSALVEIVIFMLVSLQSYMFSSSEFNYVARYLEAEQIGAIVREQEKKAAWKTAHLQYIRESEEKKRQRNLQVEKIKSEMLNLQSELHSTNPVMNHGITSPGSAGLRKRRTGSHSPNIGLGSPDIGRKQEQIFSGESILPFEVGEPPAALSTGSQGVMSPRISDGSLPNHEITEIREESCETTHIESGKKEKGQPKENPLISAVHLIGDGVSHVQSIGNQAVNNLASFLHITDEERDVNDYSCAEDGVYDEMESQKFKCTSLVHSSSLHSDMSSDATSLQIGRIFQHIWSQMRSNNDIVCYCCFVIIFLWNFSLLSMVYLAALFLYALCVNSGPNYVFWVIMLIYTEAYILLQYLYQIIIQHYSLTITSDILRELGFPTHEITSSFVISALPLFLVYLFTLLQSSISAKEGEWIPSLDLKSQRESALGRKEVLTSYNWSHRAREVLRGMINMLKLILRSFYRYWISLTQGAESPPYFVQVSIDVPVWPEDGIQPERIESGINHLLKIVHDEKCDKKNTSVCPFASRVQVQSIERSQENSNVALVVFEVVYVSPLTSCTGSEWFRSLNPAADVAKEIVKVQLSGVAEDVGFPYSILSAIGGGKRDIDLYAYVFGADLTVFFLVATFYQSVIKNNSEFLDVSQLEDQFPKEFVFILMIIFFLIVLDRIIYLCSFATGKVIFYIFNLILFTYSVTKYAWNLGSLQKNFAGLALRAIFLAKAVSLALQGTQIRYGIPHQSTLYQQFLTSEVSRINYLGYRLYRALPFLYELRCVLDWSCTMTALTMYDWLKLEDIYASLYLVKCDAELNRGEHKQGEKQTKCTKCFSGICLFFILLCVIWAPMLIYSSGNPTNIANPIKDASVQVDIKTAGGRLTLFQTSLCEKLPWDSLNSNVDLDPHGYLDAYNTDDIQLICCQGDSSSLWLVPEVVQTKFVRSLDWWDTDMDILFIWVLGRDRPNGKEVVRYERSVDPSSLPKQSDIQNVLNGSTNSFAVHNMYLRYFRVTGSAEIRPLEQEVNAVNSSMTMNRKDFNWWSLHDINSTDRSACRGLTGPMAIVISEETPPHGIIGDTISKFSIWGLYITFVLAVGRFIRLQCADLRMRIPYENLPSCDRLIAICEDIYAARAEGELGIEEVLYWTLIKIYRTPHMLLEYTKPD